jgi:hypothetical protein
MSRTTPLNSLEQRRSSVQAGIAHGCSIISLNRTPSDNSSCSTTSQQSTEHFWSDAVKKTYQRALSESWTHADIQAALIQSSLLSYRSHETAADVYGFRYIESAPEYYAHNCPWNDWTTPSESARLFHAASTTPCPYVDPVSRRIRVHVVTSADITAHAMTAFATVEMNVKGKEVLVVRRGAEILASLVLRRIHLTSVDKMVLKLEICTRRPGVPSIYLRFEDVKRLNAFIIMLSDASIENASQ